MGFRILLIGSSPRIGLTFHFTRLAIALKKGGNDVIILSDRKKQYEVLPNELSRLGIRRYISDAIDYADMMSLIRGTNDIRRILKKECSFDIIHGGGVRHGIKVFLATRRLNEKPKTYATIGSLPSSSVYFGLAKMSYNLFYDKCVTLCKYTRKKMGKMYVNNRKMSVIPLFAPDLEWFDKAKRTKINLEDYKLQDVNNPIVFYAASHFHYKGLQYYLYSASEILKKFDTTFVVGGSGPLTNYLKNLTEKLGISNHVVFTGWISNYHMPYILSNIVDICVSTSLIEQLPSYIMECMAAGKPVVASSVGGVPEIIVDGVNGYLVPPQDYKKTTNRIMYMLENLEEARKMGSNSRKTTEERLNVKSSVLRLMKVYEELV